VAPTKADIAELFEVHRSPLVASERVQRAYGLDSTRSWVDPNGYRLSDRLWRQRRWIRDQIDQTLRRAIADGEDALIVARKLEQFLSPDFAPIRTEHGRLVRNQSRAIVTTAPGRGGSGSLPARTLARTEISRAHAQGTLFSAARTPFLVGVRYALSGSHPRVDECNQLAERNSGLGPGVYNVGDVPSPPRHPNCLCRLEQVTVEDVNTVIESLRKQFAL
jgi:hypothetical protein